MSSPQTRAVAAIIAGVPVRWQDLRTSVDAVLAMCDAEDLSPLMHQRLSTLALDWPEDVGTALAAKARTAAGEELLRGVEIRAVVEALAAAGIRALLIKGTPLAYSVYPSPATRPRDDTDIIVPEGDVGAARDVLTSLGYDATNQCNELFSQFEVQKRDRFGVVHAFDVHWKISTQPVFADVLTYSEMLRRAMPVPALGPAAAAPCSVDALLLACIHPVMHHQNADRLLWICDAHFLVSSLGAREFDEFVRQAGERRVAAVCAHRLQLAATLFGTSVPAGALAELSAVAGEPSAAYLASHRRWHHELVSSLGGLPRFGDRVRLLRGVLLPSPRYMLSAYGLTGKPLAPWLLPALYMHRNVRGVWKILTGKK